MAKHALKQDTRWHIYVIAGIITAAGILATLITIGLIGLDDVQEWVTLVVALVTMLIGLGTQVLAAVNTPRRQDDELNLEDIPENWVRE